MVLHVKVGNPHLINVHFLIYTIDNFSSFSSYLLPWVVFSSSVIIYKLNVLFTSINTNKNKLNNHDKSGTSNFVTSSMMNKLTKSIDGSIISERLIDSPAENDIITSYEQFISRQKTLVVSSFDNVCACTYIHIYMFYVRIHTFMIYIIAHTFVDMNVHTNVRLLIAGLTSVYVPTNEKATWMQ